MKNKLLQLIDFTKVDTLFESFFKTTGFVTAILDLEGNILSKSGWRHICTEFHRVNPETAKNCRISDTELANKMAGGENYHFYKCLNGLVDVAAPIVIKGEHIANLFFGQFFFEEPNRDFFKKQVEKYGFDEKKYLDALEKVPVVSKNYVKVAMDFLLNMTQLISETTYQKLEQMELNNALKESEERFQLLFNKAPLGYQSLDSDGKFIEVNQQWLETLGYSREEVTGKWFGDFLTPACQNGFRERFPVFKAQGFIHSEFEMLHKDGRILFIAFDGKIGHDLKGNFKQTHCILQDITKNKRAEEALKESEERFKALHNASFGGIGIHDKGIILECNQGLSEMTGYSKEELIGMDGLLLIAPETRDLVMKNILAGYEKPYEAVGLRKNGELYPIRLEARNIPHKGKKVRTVEFRDITESKQAEEALRKSEAIKNKMVSNIGDVIVIIGKNEVNQYKSPNITTLFGWKPEEVVGKNTWDNVHPEDLEEGQKFFRSLLNKPNASGTTELRYRRKDGKYVWIEIKLINLLHDNDIQGVLGNYHDISERKKIIEELVEAKEKAQESDKLKTAFINNISHEIRTPLNGILGFGTFLSETELSPEAKNEMLAVVQKSSDRLMNTMENYMDMALIFSGTMEVHKKEFILKPVFDDVIKKTRQLCAGKQINLEVVSQPEYLDLTPESDPELITKTLNLLLDNALKFTEKGSITCGYSLKNGFIEFFVKDTGKGIAPEKLDVIFNMFTQEDPSNTRGHEGSGLGLSIAGGMVKLLGGTISVQSQPGEGSVFTFTVPYNGKDVAGITEPAEKKYGRVSEKPLVLLAEDEESNYLYMGVVLQLAGCDYLLAKDGAEAVEFCKQHPEIILVLMDIKMPVMNGLEATRHIREFRPDLPIIATTAYAQTGDKHRFLAAGCDGYLVKPIKKEELLAVLKKYSP